jgi:hypothetical protein
MRRSDCHLAVKWRRRPESNLAHPLKKCYFAAVRIYAETPADTHKAEEPPVNDFRYHASFYAAMAGCGKGNDVSQLDDQEKARLRKQALAWIRLCLNFVRKSAESDDPDKRRYAVNSLTHGLADPNLVCVRSGPDFEALPPEERAAWAAFWSDMKSARARANRLD